VGEAKNLVDQAYLRETAAIQSAAVLTQSDAAKANVAELGKMFGETGAASDIARLKSYAAMLGRSLSKPLDPDQQLAARLIPVRRRSAPPPPEGGARNDDPLEASRRLYLEMEMRGFADGKRNVLEIRDAVSAEYGPQDLAKVMTFFKSLESSGEFQLITQP
jgi:hypothetical protein